MLQKLIDFFKSLFGGGSSKPKTPPRPTPTPTTKTFPTDIDLPEVDDNEPQDGSEITPDTAVVVVKADDPIIADEPIIEEPPVVEPPVVEEPVIDDPVIDDPVVDVPAEDPPVVIGDGDMGGSSSSTGSGTTTSDETNTEVSDDQPKHKPRYLWCIDNGHGKKTRGKRSPKLENGKQLLEYEFNRDVVGRIIKALNDKGVETYNVVPEVDVDNFLSERVARANTKSSKRPKLFVSVHANAAPAPMGKWSDPSINGIETWYYHGNSRGRRLAAIFQKHLIKATGWKNRQLKSRPTNQFYVLRNTSMTAVLTENGFYNNKAQCKELLKDSVRQKIADAHVAAIMEVEEKGI